MKFISCTYMHVTNKALKHIFHGKNFDAESDGVSGRFKIKVHRVLCFSVYAYGAGEVIRDWGQGCGIKTQDWPAGATSTRLESMPGAEDVESRPRPAGAILRESRLAKGATGRSLHAWARSWCPWLVLDAREALKNPVRSILGYMQRGLRLRGKRSLCRSNFSYFSTHPCTIRIRSSLRNCRFQYRHWTFGCFCCAGK